MRLYSIKLNKFRNLTNIELKLAKDINIFIGPNASGKTSLLEALYLLGHGRSFRASYSKHMIQHDEDLLSIFIELEHSAIQEQAIPIGYQRHRNGEVILRMNAEPLYKHSDLIKQFPVLLINPESFHLLDAGPKYRRQYMDWVLFHVEPLFYELWQRFQKVLRQRNALLKAKAAWGEIVHWDHEFISLSQQIDAMRQAFFAEWAPYLKTLVQEFVGLSDFDIRYMRGWTKDKDLETCLFEGFERDKQFGYTRKGPHRSDLEFRVHHYLADQVLSRGQQKLVCCALKLAQGQFLKDKTGKKSLYLIDDLASELDQSNLQKVFNSLQVCQSQVFITALEIQDAACFHEACDLKTFHVKHGEIELMMESEEYV